MVVPVYKPACKLLFVFLLLRASGRSLEVPRLRKAWICLCDVLHSLRSRVWSGRICRLSSCTISGLLADLVGPELGQLFIRRPERERIFQFMLDRCGLALITPTSCTEAIRNRSITSIDHEMLLSQEDLLCLMEDSELISKLCYSKASNQEHSEGSPKLDI